MIQQSSKQGGTRNRGEENDRGNVTFLRKDTPRQGRKADVWTGRQREEPKGGFSLTVPHALGT